jgi:hypothetical protein
MSDEKDVEIDPRFDRAFQRGFDPATPVEEYVPDAAPRRFAEPQRPAAVASPAAGPATPTPSGPGPIVISASALGTDALPVDDVVSDIEDDASPSRNPFLLFLGIIAIALVAAGIWLFVRSGDAFNSKEVRSQGDYMSLDATIHMAPFIALLGAATAIGVLFVFAAKWRRRR